MSPVATSASAEEIDPRLARSRLEKPLTYSGSLDRFQHVEMTPVIGRLYPDVQIKDLVNAENSDAILKDLALTISQRGVVFFRNQNLSLAQQKQFTQRIGELSGKPKSSTLHIHPLYNAPDKEALEAEGNFDPEVYVISNRAQLKLLKEIAHRKTVTGAAEGWHTDSSYESLPPDYSCLMIKDTPPTGGDTLWCSATAVYDKISPPYRDFLKTLTATYAQDDVYVKAATRGNFDIMSPRGSPLNVGTKFSSIHPVVRTNPVTGKNSIFAVGLHCEKINDVHPYEDEAIRDYFLHLITHGHDMQVRYKWGQNDIAIWDNRSVYHAATYDFLEGVRFGTRFTSIGEKPYLEY